MFPISLKVPIWNCIIIMLSSKVLELLNNMISRIY